MAPSISKSTRPAGCLTLGGRSPLSELFRSLATTPSTLITMMTTLMRSTIATRMVLHQAARTPLQARCSARRACCQRATGLTNPNRDSPFNGLPQDALALSTPIKAMKIHRTKRVRRSLGPRAVPPRHPVEQLHNALASLSRVPAVKPRLSAPSLCAPPELR